LNFNSFTYLALFFIIFAASRSILRYRDGDMSAKEMWFWLLFWAGASWVLVQPGQTDHFAEYLGIKRGADVIVYASIIVVYYLVFRLYIKLNVLSHEITKLVRAIAVDRPIEPTEAAKEEKKSTPKK
jgi:hypothetical protein